MKKRPLATLRFALAAIVITFVATRVPWRDRVTAPEDGAWIEGEIAGDWRADTVLFTIAKGEVVPILMSELLFRELCVLFFLSFSADEDLWFGDFTN